MAESEIDRIGNIVRRLRDFYRPARQVFQPTEVHVILDSVLTLAGKQLQHNNVTVEREWEDGLPLIQANPDHLKQVFLNLVLNAADAIAARHPPDSKAGGTLWVRTALDQMQRQDGKEVLPAVRIEFADTGEGMPPEILNRLFEPFLTTKKDGTGLGLSISFGIIQAHNGRITAASQVGVGTTFTILLPAA
jgi:signal transduction histidine kinase